MDLTNLPPQSKVVTKIVTVSERDNDQEYFRNEIALRLFSACVVSGFDVVELCDAAHIIPVKPYNGPDKPGNCLLLAKHLHKAFDRFFFTILPNGIIIVHRRFAGSSLGQYHRKNINRLRDDHREALEWHNNQFYELYPTTRKEPHANQDQSVPDPTRPGDADADGEAVADTIEQAVDRFFFKG